MAKPHHGPVVFVSFIYVDVSVVSFLLALFILSIHAARPLFVRTCTSHHMHRKSESSTLCSLEDIEAKELGNFKS